MTVFRPDLRILLLLTLLSFGLVGVAVAQQTTEMSRQEEPPRRTYFLGEQQSGPQLDGPSVGDPLPITPEPYLEPGSLALPEPQEPIIEPGQEADTTTADGIDQATITSSEGEDPAPIETQEDALKAEAFDAAGVNAAATGLSFEEAALASFDPSLQAVALPGANREGVLTAFLWDGMSRGQAIKTLGNLGGRTGSLSLRAFARNLAMGNFSLPPSEDAGQVTDLFRARLALLEQIGATSAYIALVNSLPRGRDWTELARERSRAYLLGGRLADACAVANTARAQDRDSYWLKIAAFCAAVRGDRTQVDFQLDILATIESPGGVFYALIDHLTLVAESEASGVAPPVPEPLDEPLPTTVLLVAMARLAKMNVTAFAPESLEPLALEPALGLPDLAPDVRASLLRTAMQEGLVSYEVMQAFVNGIEASAATSDGLLETTSAFGVDGVDLAALARLLITVRDSARQDLQLTALETLWGGATVSGLELQLAPLIADQLDQLSPQPLVGQQAAIIARVMLVAGRRTQAQAWFDALRAAPAGQDLARDTALTALAPLMAGVGLMDIDRLSADPTRWWDVSSFPTGNPQDAITQRAGLLLSLLETRGRTIPETYWQALESRAKHSLGPVPQPALWRHFLRAAHYGHRADMFGALYQMVSAFGIQAVPAILAGSIDGQLRRQGMDPMADSLAFEMLVAAGL